MDLIPQYRALHAQGKFLGLSVLKFADEIRALIEQYGVETVLDYGSGQGHQYMPPHSLDKKWGVTVTMYDPAVDGLEELPNGSFDMVICSDVLEHVPEDKIEEMLQVIFARAKRIVFLTVCCREAKKKFPDGTNVHVTVRPLDWWMGRINGIAPFGVRWILRETP